MRIRITITESNEIIDQSINDTFNGRTLNAKTKVPSRQLNVFEAAFKVMIFICKAIGLYCIMVLALLYTFLKACWKST